MKSCYKCHGIQGINGCDIRPYGPQGQNICFVCAFATEDSRRETEEMCMKLLEAAGPMAMLTEDGPVPMMREEMN